MEEQSNLRRFRLTAAEVHSAHNIRAFGFSPDGKWISFVSEHVLGVKRGSRPFEKDSTADVFLLPNAGGYPRQVTSLGDVAKGGVWSPESDRLCLIRNNSLDVLYLKDGNVERIYDGNVYVGNSEVGDQHLRLPRWRPRGAALVAFAIRQSTETVLRVVSPDGTFRRDLLAVQGWITSWDWSADGQQLIVTTRSENGLDSDVRLLRIAEDRCADCRTLWTESHFQYCQPIAVWASDRGHVVYRSNRTGFAKLWVQHVDDEKGQPINEGPWDDYAFRISPNGTEIVYASTQGCNDGGDLLRVSPIFGGSPRGLTPQLGANAPLHWSRDNRIYYWHSAPTESGDLWGAQVDTDETQRLSWSTPVTLEAKLRLPVTVSVAREDGSELPILIFKPKGFDDREDQRLPAIVWIRGGPALDSYRYRPIYQWLANEGFIVAAPHYRGSTGRGVPYMNAVTGDGVGRNDLEDIMATTKHVKGLPFVDTSRGIGIGGHSWGGYLTLMAVTAFPGEFSCAVAGAAIADWNIQQSQTEVRHYDRWLLDGWAYERPEVVKSRSPIEYVDRISKPLFIYHGKDDRDVPYAQFKAFLDAARRKGVVVEEKSYEHEGHGLAKPENQRDCLDRISAFFRRHLKTWNFSDNPCAKQVE